MTALLLARDLEIRYGRQHAVHAIDLAVQQGEVVGLIGPDGAGKTSTLRVLAGLLKHTAGEVEAFGRPCWRHRRALHRKLGYLAQGFALYGDLTVHENIRFFAMLYGVRHWRSRCEEILDRVGLGPFGKRIAYQLSGGMKQKLALACTLIHSPEILLLDEPTTGVDPVTRREFWRLLGDLLADGLTLVVATPYLDEAERCTRVVLMHQGRVLADDAPSQLTRVVPGHVVEIVATPRGVAEQALRELEAVVDVAVFGSTLHVRSRRPVDIDRLSWVLRQAGVTVEGIVSIKAGLEDAFLYLTRSRALSEAS